MSICVLDVGTHGVAVTFVAQGDEEKLFKRIEENIGTTIEALPGKIILLRICLIHCVQVM